MSNRFGRLAYNLLGLKQSQCEIIQYSYKKLSELIHAHDVNAYSYVSKKEIFTYLEMKWIGGVKDRNGWNNMSSLTSESEYYTECNTASENREMAQLYIYI